MPSVSAQKPTYRVIGYFMSCGIYARSYFVTDIHAERKIVISYDDPDSLRAKAAHVQREGLGGIMCWELSSDTGEHALSDAITGQFSAH